MNPSLRAITLLSLLLFFCVCQDGLKSYEINWCGYNGLPVITYLDNNVTEQGRVNVWDKTIFNFNANTGIPQVSCFLNGDEIPSEHRYVLIYNKTKPANTAHILYRHTGRGMEKVDWNQFEADEYVAGVDMGPDKMLVYVEKGETGTTRVYKYSDISKYTILTPDLRGPITYLTRLGGLIGVGIFPTKPQIVVYYGANFEQSTVFTVNKGTAIFFSFAYSFQEQTIYSPTGTKANITVLYNDEMSNFIEISFEITYSNDNQAPTITQGPAVPARFSKQTLQKIVSKVKQAGKMKFKNFYRMDPQQDLQIDVKQSQPNKTNILDFILFRIYCEDRLFLVSIFDLCVKENNRCVIDEAAIIGKCVRQHSTKSAKLALVVAGLTTISIKLLSNKDGEIEVGDTNWILYIVIGVAALVVLSMIVVFCVLKAKRGLSFVEFITCKCFRGRAGRDEGYSKM